MRQRLGAGPLAKNISETQDGSRELGIPCVMNTSCGTTALHTGDLIRVDGAAGTVEILQRIGVPSR